MAAANPQGAIPGAEPDVTGIAMLSGKSRKAGVPNLWPHPGDLRNRSEGLPDPDVAPSRKRG